MSAKRACILGRMAGRAFGSLCRARKLWLVALIAIATLPALAQDRRGTHVAGERSGTLPTRDGLQLTLTADTGSVRIFSDASGEVRYQVRVEVEQNDPVAAALLKRFSLRARNTPRGVVLDGRVPTRRNFERAWVSYEVHVPQRYNLVISTQAGDILTQDVDGRVSLTTGGGNIQAGRVGAAGTSGDPVARLETGGGRILVGDVSGGLRAATAGGHITAGNVRGDALLRTAGGRIQIGRVSGTAQLITGGGNIVAANAGAGVVAETGGGRIEFGEATGTIHARTGGGGVRIARVVGATKLDSADGGLFLAGVEAPLRASTAAGAITAWFSPQFRGAAPGVRAGSELASGRGDIVVYLPREIAVTIDALVEQGSNHRIIADPSLALRVQMEGSGEGHSLRAQAALNGGGQRLHLRTGAGDIHLRSLNAEARRRLARRQQMAMMEQGLAAQKALLLEIAHETAEVFDSGAAAPASNAVPPPLTDGGRRGFARLFEGFWRGGVRVDPDEQQKRLVWAVRPAYPDAARYAGLEGNVALRVVVGADGAVQDVRPLSGEPELVRAALEAVARWRYAPALLDGRPVDVVTTVMLAFRLR